MPKPIDFYFDFSSPYAYFAAQKIDDVAMEFGAREVEWRPFLLGVAMKETKNRILGFERGADDYLGKPFEPQELLLRIKAILRRTEENKIAAHNNSSVIKFGNIIYDSSLAIVWKNTEKINLTSKENELLNILVKGNGETINRYVLIKNLNLESRGIDITISRLRKKIENNPKRPINILTIRGEGYALLQ